MEEKYTKAIISVNDEDEAYPLLLTESQVRLLNFLFDNSLVIEDLHFSIDNEDFHTV